MFLSLATLSLLFEARNLGSFWFFIYPLAKNFLVNSVREIVRQKGFSTTSNVLFDVDHTGCGYDSDDTAAAYFTDSRFLRSSGN